MSIKIRLAKTGKKNAPAYKIVVAETRSKRNGKYLAILGDFNPVMGGKPVIDKAKLAAWVQKGALLTDSVQAMLDATYTYSKYNPKSEQAEKETASEASSDVKEPTA